MKGKNRVNISLTVRIKFSQKQLKFNLLNIQLNNNNFYFQLIITLRLRIQQNSTDQTNIERMNSETFRAKHCCEHNRTKQNTKLIPFLSDSVDTLTALQLCFQCNCVVCSTVWCAGGACACACDHSHLNENFYLKL